MPSTMRCCAVASGSVSPCCTGSTRISSNSNRTCPMELTLLGTGCPQCDPDRLGPASLVHHAGGASGGALDAVFLTHLHSDHIVDLFQLVISSWHQGRDRPQRVFGPPGTQRFVDGLLALWRPELEQRIAHERRPSTAALALEVAEIEAGEIFAVDGLTVEAVPVDHLPV